MNGLVALHSAPKRGRGVAPARLLRFALCVAIAWRFAAPSWADPPEARVLILNGLDPCQAMLKNMPAGRAGTPDEVAALAALVMVPEGGFITGSDFVIDGGATANFYYGPDAAKA